MMIQDVFRMRFADQGDIKWKDHVLDFLNQAMVDPTTSRTWWINFTSASGGGLPKTFAAEVNGLFTDWLERQIGAVVEINRLGTVPMDFPSHRMIDALIAANFATSTNLVEVDNRDYDVRLASPGNPHCLADCHNGSFIVPGTVVYLQSMQADMNGYVYLIADSQFNLWYSASASKAQQWAVERVDPTVSGYIVRGERVRFKSLQQTNDAGKRMYLSAESDGYLGTRSSASDGAEKNLGIEWTIG